MIASIPYETFPFVTVGPLRLSMFGFFAGVGMCVGASVAARFVAARSSVDPAEVRRTAVWLVIAGFVGARLTWALSHLELIGDPLDVVAVWNGGLQFSGGFLGAIVAAVPIFRRWSRADRWFVVDGFAAGLCVGLAFGRVGCYSVGEHFGRPSDAWLTVRYVGGVTRERSLGPDPLYVGRTFHNLAAYELMLLVCLGVAMWLVARRQRRPGVLMGLFLTVYAPSRFLLDRLRVNDERVAGLTGAQFLMVGLTGASVWIWTSVIPRLGDARPVDGSESAADPGGAPGSA